MAGELPACQEAAKRAWAGACVIKELLVLTLLVAPPAAAQPATPPRPGAEQAPLGGEKDAQFSVDLLDRTADPCSDFYRFACGAWLGAHPVPPDYPAFGRLAELAARNEQVLARILDRAASATEARDESIHELGDYWVACLDEVNAEKRGTIPLAPALTRIALLRNAKEAVLEALRLRREGVPALLDPVLMLDTGEAIAQVNQGGLALPDRDYYIQDEGWSRKLREEYLHHVARMFALLGDGEEQAAQEARRVLRVEAALAAGFPKQAAGSARRRAHHPMTAAELEKLAPNMPWPVYVAALGRGPADSLDVAAPGYLKELNVLLVSSELEDWKSYLRWTVVHDQAPRLTKAFVEEDFRFFGRVLRGVETLPPRWRRCVAAADRDLPDLLGRAYSRAAFEPAVKGRAQTMLAILQRAAGTELEKFESMDAQTRARVREKLASLLGKVGSPDAWLDSGRPAISRDSWPANAARAATTRFDRMLAKLGQPPDRLEWTMRVSSVGVAYDAERNAVTLPAGMLKPPVFDLRIDDAPNFGALGSAIGHELMHAFDDQAARDDAPESSSHAGAERTPAAFERLAACTERQFSEYLGLGGGPADAGLARLENVADLGGLRIAYSAFESAIAGVRQRLAPRREGFTPEQRFFLGFAQLHCSNLTSEERRLRATTAGQAPPQYRVNGPLSNMKEFQAAFECPQGAPMVRKSADRCEVW